LGWVYLLLAGGVEIAFTTAIRYTEGFTKLWPTALVLGLATISFYLVARSTETVPLGTAYAAWGGLGAAGTAVIGILYFGEPATFWRLVFLTSLIGSIVGLKLAGD
jgi:quaternary ammonium compound-resistance protein SugE